MTAVSCLSLLEAAVVLRQPEASCFTGFSATALSFYGLSVGFWHSHSLEVFWENSNI